MRNLIKGTLIAGGLALGMAGAVQAADSDVVIGVQLPMTGPQATYGNGMLGGVKLALEDINNSGGVNGHQVKITVGDAACDPQQSVNAAHKLASRNVDGVVGGYCSGATLPTLQVYGKTNTPFVIAASNSTKLIDANPGSAFLINSTGDAQADTAVSLFESKDADSLAIINRGDAYSQNLAELTRDSWKKAGHEVSVYATVNNGQQDFSSLVSKITARNPDAVFWTAYYSEGGLLIKQLRRGGYQGIVAVGDGSSAPKFFDIAGRASEGVYCFSNPIAKFLPNANKFIKRYKEKFDRDPGPYSALSYDSLRLMAWAINKAGTTDSEQVIKALASADGQDWLTGPISFTPEHTLERSNFVVLKGHDGEWKLSDFSQ